MIAVFDIETNGLFWEDSVLSFSCVILDDNMKIVEVIDKYYYPEESYNCEAISINGLTRNVLKEKRTGVRYPRLFKNDKDIKKLFIDGSIDLFIVYSIDFTMGFIAHHFNINMGGKNYCVMRKVQFQYNAPYPYIFGEDFDNLNLEPKLPSFEEALEWAKVNTEKIHKKTGKSLHNSLFDAYCILELYKKLKKLEKIKKD